MKNTLLNFSDDKNKNKMEKRSTRMKNTLLNKNFLDLSDDQMIYLGVFSYLLFTLGPTLVLRAYPYRILAPDRCGYGSCE